MLPIVKLEFYAFIIIWSIVSATGIISFLLLYRYALKNSLINKNKSLLWVYNDEYEGQIENLLIIMKFCIILPFVVILIIPMRHININRGSLAVLIGLILLAAEKAKSAVYRHDEVKSVQYSTWEAELNKYECTIMYKSRVFWLTVGIFPMIFALLYGNMLFKVVVLLAIILGVFSLSSLYSLIFVKRSDTAES